QIADEDGLVERDLVHGYGDHHFEALTAGLDGPGLVDVGEDDAAEDGALRVGIARHHQHTDRGLIPLRAGFLHYEPACEERGCCSSSLVLTSMVDSLRKRCRRTVLKLRASCCRSISA